MINSLPAFTNYTDIRNVLADNEVVSVQQSLSSVMIMLIAQLEKWQTTFKNYF